MTDANFSTAPRRLLDLSPELTLPGRNRTKADVRRVRDRGRAVAVKDYGARPWWIRATLGRWLIAREADAWRLADGLPGIPSFVGRVGPYALATEWIDGRRLADTRPGEVPDAVFAALRRVLDGLHARGLALADLHHRDVIVDERGAVWLVDLAAAWRRGGWRSPVWRRLCELDRLALVRMRARAAGADPDAAAEAAGGRAAAWHARGRRARRWLDRLRGRRR